MKLERDIGVLYMDEMYVNDSVNVAKSNQSWTPEKYLMCKNVRFGKVGKLKYHKSELAKHGVVIDTDFAYVKRTAEDLFNPENMESLKGKPVTYKHPKKPFVDVGDIKDTQIGTVLDARQDGDYLVGDIIITHSKIANAIWDNKINGVSIGYLAKIVLDEVDGEYMWKTKVNNHLAITETPREKEAMIVDSDWENGGEEQVETETPQKEVQPVADDISKSKCETHEKVETAYDTETGEEVRTVTKVEVYRYKREKGSLEVADESAESEVIVKEEPKVEPVIDENKNIKEEVKMKTIKEYMDEYKSVTDSYPDSEAKEALLKELNDGCLADHKISLVPKVVTDTAFKGITAKKEVEVTKKENLLVVTDEDLEAVTDEFYEKLNPMNTLYHDSYADGKKFLDKVNAFNGRVQYNKMKRGIA